MYSLVVLSYVEVSAVKSLKEPLLQT